MSRKYQRISNTQTLAGLAVATAVLAAIVAGLHMLVEPTEQLPPLGAPAEPDAPALDDPCPDPTALTGARTPITVSSSDLIECPRAYDGKHVTYTGEAVRAVLRRGDRAWVQLNDDPYALTIGPLPEHRTAVGGNSGIPVSIPTTVADRISAVGDHRHHGDRIRVTGTYQRADPANGGGPTIQARTATIDQPGRVLQQPASPRRALVAAVLGLAVLALTLMGSWNRRHQ